MKQKTMEKVVETKNKVKTKLTPSQEQKVFVVRFALFTVFALILPIIFIGWRYELFRKVGKVSLSGWGLIAIIIAIFFVRYVAKMVKRVEPYSMFNQIVTGFRKIILPLFVLFILLNTIRGSIDLFMQALEVTIISEAIGIPINPLPKWANDHDIEKQETFIDKFVKKTKGGSK